MIPFVVPRLIASPSNLEEALTLLSLCDCLRLDHQWPASPSRTPASVWLGHADSKLFVLAYLPDAEIWSTASEHNQKMWELGDVFEAFLQAEGHVEYVEMHVTPSNYRLQLRFPDREGVSRVRAREAFEEFVLPEGTFSSETAIRPEDWVVFASIPSSVIFAAKKDLSGKKCKFSFCRFDYDAGGGEPVHSSTSDYKELDFHRIEEWGMLQFE